MKDEGGSRDLEFPGASSDGSQYAGLLGAHRSGIGLEGMNVAASVDLQHQRMND